MPQEVSCLATYGNREVKLLVEYFRSNYLTEEEETSIIAQSPALHTRLVRQKAISPNHVFSNVLASRPQELSHFTRLHAHLVSLSSKVRARFLCNEPVKV